MRKNLESVASDTARTVHSSMNSRQRIRQGEDRRSPSETMSPFLKSGWKRYGIPVLSLVVCGAALWLNRGTLGEIAKRGPSLLLLLLGTSLLVIETFIVSFRWGLILRCANVPIAYGSVVRLIVFSRASQLLLPLPSGNDLALLGLVASSVPRRVSAMGTVMIDRIIGLTGLFTLAAVVGTAARLGRTEPHELLDRLQTLTVLITFGLWGLLALMLSGPARDLVIRLTPTSRGKHFLSDLSHGLQGLAAHPAVFLLTLGLAMVTHLFTTTAFYFATCALRLTETGTGWSAFVLVVPFIFVTTVLPIPVGAIVASLSVSEQLFRLIGIEGGALAFLGYNVVAIAAVCLLVPVLWLSSFSGGRNPADPPPAASKPRSVPESVPANCSAEPSNP